MRVAACHTHVAPFCPSRSASQPLLAGLIIRWIDGWPSYMQGTQNALHVRCCYCLASVYRSVGLNVYVYGIH